MNAPQLKPNLAACIGLRLVVACLLWSSAPLRAQYASPFLDSVSVNPVITFNNPNGGDWNNPTNWDQNIVPGADNDISITNSGNYTITLSTNSAIHSLILGGASGTQSLIISNPSASFTVSGSVLVGVNGVLTFSGSTIDFPYNSQVAGVFNWDGGILGSNSPNGNVIVTATGTMNLLGARAEAFYEPVASYGRTVWSNVGNLIFSASSPAVTFSNLPGAVFDIQNNQVVSFANLPVNSQPAAGFYNSGLFRKSTGTTNQVTSVQVPFHNDGMILPLVGHLNFSDGLSLATSSTLQFPIGGLSPGGQFGTIAVTPLPAISNAAPTRATLATPGNIGLAGALNVGVTNGYSPNVGDSFQLMTFGLKEGGFATPNLGSVSNGFIEVQLPSDARSLMAVIKTTNGPASAFNPTNLPAETVATGSTVTFVAPEVGALPFTYQWQFDGTNIFEETNATLTFVKAQTNNTGSICVSVTDALMQNSFTYCGSLSVYPLPSFTVQPVSQSSSNGGTIFLQANVLSQLPLQYQWRCNGVNIWGATSPVFTVTTNAQPWDGGTFDVLAASAVGVVSCTDAVVTIASASLPFADFPGGSITGFTNDSLDFSGSGNNTGVTNQPGDPAIGGNPALHQIWVQWTAPLTFTNAVVELDTVGSSFDTLLGVFAGSSVTNLTQLAADDDSGGHLTSQVFFKAHGGTSYQICVDGFAGATGEVVLNGILNTNIFSVAQFDNNGQPLDQAVPFGGTVTFSTSVSNSPGATYHWNKNGWLMIAGATNSVLTFTNVTDADVDVYNLTVTDTNGQALDSARASLEIGPAGNSYGKLKNLLSVLPGGYLPHLHIKPPLAASGFPSVSVGTIGSQLINNFNSTTEQGEPVNAVIGGASRWYLLTAVTNATLEIDTLGSDIATILSVYTGGDIFSLRVVANNINGASDGIHSKVEFLAQTGTNYLVSVAGVNGAQGNINLNWRMGIPPVVSGSSQPVMLANGAILNLQAVVDSGVTAPLYQWQLNGVNVTGETNATFTLSSIRFNQVGVYSVIVSNLVGMVVNPVADVSAQTPLVVANTLNGLQISGSATQSVVLQLSTNLATWSTIYTNSQPLLPVNFLDTNSSNLPSGFFRYKSWP